MTFFIISLTPSVTIYYEATSCYCWLYVETPQAFLYAITESCLLTPISLLSLSNYIIIIIGLHYMQQRSSIRRNMTSPTERRILIQSIALFSFTTISVFFDFFSFYLLPNTKWIGFTFNLIRHFCLVMVPILNLIFNLSLRKKALQYTTAAIHRLSSSSSPPVTQHAAMLTAPPIDAGGITSVNITKF
ncbi:hypothetical protein Tcan_13891 [Toxocara canis]|uniref:G_PROTEIN_RECEP_F1_2 domain-containing protein n=1 Tax=Toxocara canis TaxID=6265 RepID=A0A0B2V1S8_TOXCA|nr:hypothetical protein Tcan_13891 [Toxocara canis]